MDTGKADSQDSQGFPQPLQPFDRGQSFLHRRRSDRPAQVDGALCGDGTVSGCRGPGAVTDLPLGIGGQVLDRPAQLHPVTLGFRVLRALQREPGSQRGTWALRLFPCGRASSCAEVRELRSSVSCSGVRGAVAAVAALAVGLAGDRQDHREAEG
ncbi:hypothetical protein Slala02_27790 [Streptomyces lavendulae subsp. lavendulae]|nr:hypothetical protein Slala01_31080 [Streptomyces lavendulae subsp. lavendulae]GLX26959.1 hypothetical protein Slala02_27790 [Streptomyces lavendulae subsp. lavendulae]